MTKFKDCEASSWCCWRCGKAYAGIMPWTLTARPHSAIEDKSNVGFVSAPVCRPCVEDPAYNRDLFIWSHLQTGQQVWWKLRLSLAWRIIRAKGPWSVGLRERQP